MGVTEEFCRSLRDIEYAALPAEAVRAARRVMLDGIAVAVAGTREQAPHILADHLRELGGAEQATAINFGFRTSAVNAAYLNGASMHVLDYEPMWDPPNHATSTTLPAVLALGETTGASGAEMLTALVKGIEAQGRLRRASRQFEPRELTFHPPGLVGSFSSAVAAAHLLRLDLAQMRNAVGLAASRAGTVGANIGTMTKCTHCGLAAAMGVDAAMLAKRGFTANQDVFEALHGYAEVFFDSKWDNDALVPAGAPLRIVKPGFAIKMFPSQFATHYVIRAALDVYSRIADKSAIKSVEILGPEMAYVDRPRPTSGLEGKFSFQYVAAAGLLDGAVTIDTYTDERCMRSDVAALLPKVSFVQSPEIPASLDRMWVEITVELANGERVKGRCTKLKGAWGEPLSDDEHLVKVRDCLRRAFDDATAETCIATVQQFDTVDSSQVHGLMRTLGNFGGR